MQWTLALVLMVLMVFGVTFVVQYLGNTDSKPGDPPRDPRDPLLELTFLQKVFPPDGQSRIEQEQGTDVYHDFWFVNENKRPVGLWLKKESCKCSEVLAFLASTEYQERRSGVVAAQVVGPAVNFLSGLGLMIGAEKDPGLAKSAERVEGTKLGDNVHVKVPAGALGWVRVTWKGDRQAAPVTTLSADLWMDQKDTGLVAKLEAGVRFLPPLRIKGDLSEIKLGEMNARDLPRDASIVYWSGTRSELAVQPRMVSIRKQPDRDPFVVGSPVPLPNGQLAELRKQLKEAGEPGPVLCAYRVPITIRDRGSDGKTWLDVGPFRRQVEFLLEGKTEPAATVTLMGRVQSDLMLSGAGNEGQISFSVFISKRGKTKTVTVWTDRRDIKLEVDRERTASFLKVRLPEKPEVGEGGRQTWELTVEIPPGQVYGRFPSNDDLKRDCAVYLKTGRPDEPTLRIPVEGLANLE